MGNSGAAIATTLRMLSLALGFAVSDFTMAATYALPCRTPIGADLMPRCVLRHRGFEVGVDLVEEAAGREPFLIGTDEKRQVLGHETGLYRADGDLFQGGGEFRQFRIVVELGAVGEAAGPGEDRGDGIGRSFAAVLVFAVVPRHRAVGGLGFDHL